ncbi:MAG: HAD family hydrolase [Gammaproteobacteria bacterium]|nr:HAD family hydrolase [Gammaproteobacteria bacterium]
MAWPYRLILIDFFNTLAIPNPSKMPKVVIDGKEIITTAGLLSSFFKELGLEISPESLHTALIRTSKIIEEMRGAGEKEVPAIERFRMLIDGLGVNKDEEYLAKGALKVHMEAVENCYDLPEHNITSIRKLNSRFALGLLSNCDYSDLVRNILNSHRLAEKFNPLVISAELGYRKPGFEAFHRTLALAKVEPVDVLFVGDSLEDDVQGANKAGIDVAWINPKNKILPSGITTTYQLKEFQYLPGILGIDDQVQPI